VSVAGIAPTAAHRQREEPSADAGVFGSPQPDPAEIRALLAGRHQVETAEETSPLLALLRGLRTTT
jgi:hypothetical protein